MESGWVLRALGRDGQWTRLLNGSSIVKARMSACLTRGAQGGGTPKGSKKVQEAHQSFTLASYHHLPTASARPSQSSPQLPPSTLLTPHVHAAFCVRIMATTSPVLEALSTRDSRFLLDPEEHEKEPEEHEDNNIERSSDGDTASQRSISLSSPPRSPRTATHQSGDSLDVTPHEDPLVTPVTLVRQGLANANRESHTYTLDTDFSSEHDYHDDGDDRSSFMRRLDGAESPFSSVAPSLHEEEDKENVEPGEKPVLKGLKEVALVTETQKNVVEVKTDEEADIEEQEGQDIVQPLPSASSRHSFSSRASITSFVTPSSYPPPPRQSPDPRGSVASFASGSTSASYSKKVRPESMLVQYTGPLILGIAVVDFNHLVGPKIEFSRGSICEDEEIAKILPFLALPDGAHLVSIMVQCMCRNLWICRRLKTTPTSISSPLPRTRLPSLASR